LSHLPADMAVACYRIVQEAITNAMRHAEAHHVSVALHKDDRELAIVVRDDGVGFDVMHAQQRAAQGQSLGLLGMEERIRLLEGRLSIRSSPGTGTEVTASIPLPPDTRRTQE
jgi:signal transduction histidine kinase